MQVTAGVFTMKKRSAPICNRLRGCGGATLVELTLAMFISAIVISLTFYAWNQINIHVARGQERSFFRVAGRRMLDRLSDDLRRSTALLAHHSSGVTFVSASGDTLNYEFYGRELLRNGEPVPTADSAAFITDFQIESSEQEQIVGGVQDVLLEITLSLENERGYVMKRTVAVAVRKPPGASADFWAF